MSINSISTQIALNSILAQLQNDDGVTRENELINRGSGRNDSLRGTTDSDSISARDGNDFVLANLGDDQISGDAGNDVIFGGEGNDTISGGSGANILFGDAGNDSISAGDEGDFISGGEGNDALVGGAANDLLSGNDGVDTLTGGAGPDQFLFEGDPFNNGAPAPAGQTGILALNRPDVITDFSIGEDQFMFSRQDLGIDSLSFQQGVSSQIGDGNAIVLTDPFPAAGAAARAIANNPNITADEGVFAYFNSTLGITRLVYSQDLGDGGPISVLANLPNQQGQQGLANMAAFTPNNFTLI